MFDSPHTADAALAPPLVDRRARPRLPAPPPRPVLSAACAAAADLAAVVLVMIGAGAAVPAAQAPLMAALLLAMVCVFAARGHFTTRLPFGREAADIATATIVALAVFSVLATRLGAPPGVGTMLHWLVFMPICLALRVVAAVCARRSGAGTIRTLIVGGGAADRMISPSDGWGPSPRGRGSPCVLLRGNGFAGSIPAWAGEPGVP